MLEKLFSHNLKNDALKWYFTLHEKSIDKYENLVHNVLNNFK